MDSGYKPEKRNVTFQDATTTLKSAPHVSFDENLSKVATTATNLPQHDVSSFKRSLMPSSAAGGEYRAEGEYTPEKTFPNLFGRCNARFGCHKPKSGLRRRGDTSEWYFHEGNRYIPATPYANTLTASALRYEGSRRNKGLHQSQCCRAVTTTQETGFANYFSRKAYMADVSASSGVRTSSGTHSVDSSRLSEVQQQQQRTNQIGLRGYVPLSSDHSTGCASDGRSRTTPQDAANARNCLQSHNSCSAANAIQPTADFRSIWKLLWRLSWASIRLSPKASIVIFLFTFLALQKWWEVEDIVIVVFRCSFFGLLYLAYKKRELFWHQLQSESLLKHVLAPSPIPLFPDDSVGNKPKGGPLGMISHLNSPQADGGALRNAGLNLNDSTAVVAAETMPLSRGSSEMFHPTWNFEKPKPSLLYDAACRHLVSAPGPVGIFGEVNMTTADPSIPETEERDHFPTCRAEPVFRIYNFLRDLFRQVHDVSAFDSEVQNLFLHYGMKNIEVQQNLTVDLNGISSILPSKEASHELETDVADVITILRQCFPRTLLNSNIGKYNYQNAKKAEIARKLLAIFGTSNGAHALMLLRHDMRKPVAHRLGQWIEAALRIAENK